MADFRRVVTALAVLVLLTGFAVAANAQPYSCNASAAVPPLLRGEGLTELAGDILLTCANTPGGTNPTANFTIFLGGSTTFTSRILTATTNATEAALLIDEPTGTFAIGTNTFQGILTGSNAITFTGVPLINPTTSVAVRNFRITNLRVNASNLATPNAVTQVTALISISGSTSVPLNNPQQIIGFVQARSMNFSVLGTDGKAAPAAGFSFKQCEDNTAKNIGTIQFAEQFASAFKPKVDVSGSQTATGSVYNTESGLMVGFGGVTSKDASGANAQAGLADFGTRLRATFKGIPANVKLYVSAGNVSGVGTATANKTEAGKLEAATTTTVGSATVVQVSLDASGNGSVVWEVTDASPIVLDKFQFNVYISAAPTPGPAAGITATAGTVAGSYAPTYTDPAAAQASATLPIPRFIDTGSANNLLIFTVCQTNLLFPYVINVAGFDTGLAITNTGKDPFSTVGQSGTCSLNFYGANPPATNPVVTGVLGNATGDTTNMFASSALTLAPGFSGYVIAVCNFQYAHGFAFVSDIGAHDVAMGYLALVLPSSNRAATATPENLNN